MTQSSPSPLARETALKVGKRYIQTLGKLTHFDGKRWTYEQEKREVVLLAVSGIHAMVRRPKCTPYVCSVSQLSHPTDNKQDERSGR